MKAQMDVLQHVGAHVAVQKHERVGRCLRNSKAHLIFWLQVRDILVVVVVSHHVSLARDFAPPVASTKALPERRNKPRFDVTPQSRSQQFPQSGQIL
jgi:hypothetical protein